MVMGTYFNLKAACSLCSDGLVLQVKWLHDNDNEIKMEYIFLEILVPGNNVVVF